MHSSTLTVPSCIARPAQIGPAPEAASCMSQNVSCPVIRRGRGRTARRLFGLFPRPDGSGQTCPGPALSCIGQGQSDHRRGVRGRMVRQGLWIAKSLRCLRVLHLGGLCKPEPRNGVGLAAGEPYGHRRSSRLRWEAGRREAGFRASVRPIGPVAPGRDANGPKDLRGCQNECAGLGKEFRFADI